MRAQIRLPPSPRPAQDRNRRESFADSWRQRRGTVLERVVGIVGVAVEAAVEAVVETVVEMIGIVVEMLELLEMDLETDLEMVVEMVVDKVVENWQRAQVFLGQGLGDVAAIESHSNAEGVVVARVEEAVVAWVGRVLVAWVGGVLVASGAFEHYWGEEVAAGEVELVRTGD